MISGLLPFSVYLIVCKCCIGYWKQLINNGLWDEFIDHIICYHIYLHNLIFIYSFYFIFFSSSFKLFLESDPQLRDILHMFYQSKYDSCLTLLEKIKVY